MTKLPDAFVFLLTTSRYSDSKIVGVFNDLKELKNCLKFNPAYHTYVSAETGATPVLYELYNDRSEVLIARQTKFPYQQILDNLDETLYLEVHYRDNPNDETSTSEVYFGLEKYELNNKV